MATSFWPGSAVCFRKLVKIQKCISHAAARVPVIAACGYVVIIKLHHNINVLGSLKCIFHDAQSQTLVEKIVSNLPIYFCCLTAACQYSFKLLYVNKS